MAVLNSGLEQAFTPEDYGKLIDTVVDAKSIAFQVGTVVNTSLQSIRFPILKADPSTGWFAENTTITLVDPDTEEVVVTPTKVAGRTQISNEAASDSDPAVASIVGTGLARDIAKKIDNAFFGNTVTNGPSGLLSLSATAVDTGTITAVANLDFFHDAKKKAYDNNSELTHFVISPAIALQLAKIKVLSNGSNQGLLETVDDGVLLAGLPALVSPSVDALTFAWGIDASQVMVVRRTGTTIATSKDAAFGEDALQIRATSRVGFGFANPAGVIRLYDAA